MFYRLWAVCVQKLFRPRWVVNLSEDSYGEFGVKIMGVCFYYYKWDDPFATKTLHPHRLAEKREFGEVILSGVKQSV